MISGIRAFFHQRLSMNIAKDAPDAGEFRAHQLHAVIQVTPLMMAANVINALIICVAFSGKPFALVAWIWGAAITAMAVAGYLSWRKSHAHAFPSQISRRTLGRVTRNSTLLGILWGALPLFAYPGGDLATKLVVVGFVGGMMGGGSFALYMVPGALAGYLASIAGLFTLTLAMSAGPGDLTVGVLLGMYAYCLYVAGINIAHTFAASKISESRVEEQASIIGLLLKEFEESASDWLWETDLDGQIKRGGQRFADLCGLEADELSKFLSDGVQGRFSPDSEAVGKGFAELFQRMRTGQHFSALALHMRRRDGADVWLSVSGKPIMAKDGRSCGYRGVASNITAEKQSKERIAYLAHNDALTGLVNRANFTHAIERCFDDRRVAAGEHFAIFFLDLDGFKLINDTKGHKIGDDLLIEVGARVKRSLRAGDIVARLGGDEFAVLLRGDAARPALAALAEKIIDHVSRSYDIDGQLINVGVSIGIAIGPIDGRDAQALLNSADLALYRSKEEGKGTYRFFEMEMDEVVRDRRVLEQELRTAVKNMDFELHFQPLVSAADDRTMGFEALIRWNHPTRGTVSPADFIPLAEKTGLVGEIGDWVLMEACRTATSWPEHMTISVNLSPQQFQNRRIVSATRKALLLTGLKPSRLELEITEGLFVENTEEALAALGELKGLGVMTSLDDFGTGYSSLSYLLKFPFDKLKIDQSFIRSIEKDKTARDILETIARLGKILNLSVTAEGVETADQAEFLSTMACTQMQGFHFGRPIPMESIPQFLLEEARRQMAKPKQAGQKRLRAA